MRYRVYAIVHLMILVIYICRPVMPYVQYAIFKDYIVKNLCINRDKPKCCCQGKCYLEKQLKKSSETSDSEEKNTNKKAQNKEVKEFLNSHIAIPQVFEGSISTWVYTKPFVATVYILSVFIPPEIKPIS